MHAKDCCNLGWSYESLLKEVTWRQILSSEHDANIHDRQYHIHSDKRPRYI